MLGARGNILAGQEVSIGIWNFLCTPASWRIEEDLTFELASRILVPRSSPNERILSPYFHRLRCSATLSDAVAAEEWFFQFVLAKNLGGVLRLPLDLDSFKYLRTRCWMDFNKISFSCPSSSGAR